ncbi:50S ribosomal protein L19e [Candidatus Woesearchaeota archaeon]|nr:50S ribosomal protein L19e [Candidatus Woesearchaeota archaeon]
MDLQLQKRLAGSVLKASTKRVKIDFERMEELGVKTEDLKQAITKKDVAGFIADGIITEKQKKGVSRGRARKSHIQKTKGRQQGHGSRKGKPNARRSTKRTWINKIRLQRAFLKELNDKGLIDHEVYKKSYGLAKGNFFRNKRHVKIYLEERGLFKK